MDHGDREAGNQEVQTVSDVEAERTPHVSVEEYEDPEGGYHRAQGRGQGKPIREQHAGEDPQQRESQIEERRGAEGNENERRHEGADHDGELRQHPVEARARHA